MGGNLHGKEEETLLAFWNRRAYCHFVERGSLLSPFKAKVRGLTYSNHIKEKEIVMMKKSYMIALVFFLVGGSDFAQLGGGMGGGGMGGTNGGQMGGGMGSGMVGAGGMVSGMMGNTMSHGYLDVFSPLTDSGDAEDAIQAFLVSSNSNLKISELWEYETAYVAELSDVNGAKAFDLIADKFTGAVTPEMGLSMMMNASYGRSLYKMSGFKKNLNLTPEEATTIAGDFVTDNLLGYTLGLPETYPGYYKFHTTITGSTNPGMDIMVGGYNGGIWMNTLLGVPIRKIF